MLVFSFYIFIEHSCFIQERSDEDDGSVEDKWDLVPESALKCIILTHNQLFGSPDLIEKVNSNMRKKMHLLLTFMISSNAYMDAHGNRS